MRFSLLVCFLLICSCSQSGHASQSEADYYKLFNSLPQQSSDADVYDRNLVNFIVRAWPERGYRGYIPSSDVRSAEERLAFIRALQRLIRERLLASGNPTSESEAYRQATFSSMRKTRSPLPLAFQTLQLSLDDLLDEADIWRLIEIRLREATQLEVFKDLDYLYPPAKIRWTPAARAIFALACHEAPTLLGIRRLLARYQQEAYPMNGKADMPTNTRQLALPIHGLYTSSVVDMLALIEGQHLWRDQGRVELAAQATSKLKALTASLSAEIGRDVSAELIPALAAPVRYSPVVRSITQPIYWPESAGATMRQWQSGVPVPSDLRWVRTNQETATRPSASSTRLTRRVGSSDSRWWPASQEAYLDLAYRRLPELLRRQLSRAGRLDVFRVWHAGAEDGSQTFLLAALLDEAVAVLASDPSQADLLDELRSLRIEIIATDYAYMPNRQGLTYRFDVSGHIGDLHHKWNLVADENPRLLQSTVAGIEDEDEVDQVSSDALRERSAGFDWQKSASTLRERALRWRTLADEGLVGQLLGRLLTLAPEVDVPSGQWQRDRNRIVAKHRYRFINQDWRIVELDGDREIVVNPGTSRRLMRFEKGDMTRSLPKGFEQGNGFDLSVVTGVLPYIYGYYRQQGDVNLTKKNVRKGSRPLATPMEAAQSLLQKGTRKGGWILFDKPTEQAALEAKGRSHMLDANYDNWTDAWVRWVGKKLPQRQIEVYVTRDFGIELLDPIVYQRMITDG